MNKTKLFSILLLLSAFTFTSCVFMPRNKVLYVNSSFVFADTQEGDGIAVPTFTKETTYGVIPFTLSMKEKQNEIVISELENLLDFKKVRFVDSRFLTNLYSERNIELKEPHQHFGYKLKLDEVLKIENLHAVRDELGIDILIAIAINSCTLPQMMSTECQLSLSLLFYDTSTGTQLLSATGYARHFSSSYYRENALRKIYNRLFYGIFDGYDIPLHISN